jgi:hypothetical protein
MLYDSFIKFTLFIVIFFEIYILIGMYCILLYVVSLPFYFLLLLFPLLFLCLPLSVFFLSTYLSLSLFRRLVLGEFELKSESILNKETEGFSRKFLFVSSLGPSRFRRTFHFVSCTTRKPWQTPLWSYSPEVITAPS